MAMKNDRVCVSRYYPIANIKPNRMYIVRYCNSLFIANGKIYLHVRKEDEDKYYCITILNFKKWGGIENLKNFAFLKGKKKEKTISDLMNAVLKCGYKRELDFLEFMEIEEDCLLENSDYKYSIDDLVFRDCENLYNGFEKMELSGYGLQIGKCNDTQIHFCLDLSVGGIRKDLPKCLLKEIEHEANRLLEVNFVKPEEIKKVNFTCYTKVQLNHYINRKDGKHIFYRNYSIHIEINRISNYYDDFSLDNVDNKFLKHADFYLCDKTSEMEKAFDKFIRNEIFH